ncbi:glutamate--tRNA ligase [candidate division KSB1 bacterium]|nr:glutamate--tRNA ligase [candidate division KSB1 bacterium]
MRNTSEEVRVRFAPSPTGYLHVGGARTAIFNWLYARNKKGKFLIRIEDTDVARSSKEMVDAIFEGLKWLDLKWDEEPVYQSNRIGYYRQICQQLVEQNKAYYCYCSQEKLAQRSESYKYDGHCRNLTDGQRSEYERLNVPKAIRFKVPQTTITFVDAVRGSLKFNSDEIDDFIILKSDGMPTYHLAVVADDHDMKITHVIRGDDHLSNTPKHVLLYQALNWSIPAYSHLPLILGPDKKRLSKRHGATAVSEYREMGILPDAMFNFLTLLGWNPGSDQEIMSREQIVNRFSLSKINKSNAIFDEQKLIWMNGNYIRQTDDAIILNLVRAQLIAENLIDPDKEDREYLLKVISLLKPRMKFLNEFAETGFYFFRDPEEYNEKAKKKHWKGVDVGERLEKLYLSLENVTPFGQDEIEKNVRELAEELEISAAKLIHPARVSLTGSGSSPGIFEVMEALGKDVVIRRLKKAVSANS